MRCLILRLQGPLMSFGDVAIDEIRLTRRLPCRSMLTGLLANALGYEHREVDRLTRLQERLRFAARLDRPGTPLRDFQTAEISKRDPLWTTRRIPAERAGGEGSYAGPVLRWRHYLADASVTIALTLTSAQEKPDLATVEAALLRPERPLFLGRKGCPPADRLLQGRLDATSLAEALGAGGTLLETEDEPGEPAGTRVVEVADRRDWRLGFHAGLGRRRELHGRSETKP